MERGHLTPCCDGNAIERGGSAHRASSNVAWRRHHDAQHIFNKHRIG
jgi:hypothetical protein